MMPEMGRQKFPAVMKRANTMPPMEIVPGTEPSNLTTSVQ